MKDFLEPSKTWSVMWGATGSPGRGLIWAGRLRRRLETEIDIQGTHKIDEVLWSTRGENYLMKDFLEINKYINIGDLTLSIPNSKVINTIEKAVVLDLDMTNSPDTIGG